MKLAAPSISGRSFLALLWLLSVSSLPSLSSAQSAAELLALASRAEGSVTVTKTKANVTAPVDLSLVSYDTGSGKEGDEGNNAAGGDGAGAGDEAHDLQLGNITSVDQGRMNNITAHGPSYNMTDINPEDKPSASVVQVPTDLVPETGPADDAPAVMSNEPIDNNIESANVVSPDSYAATSGSISYLRRGRRQLAAKKRR